MKRWVVSDILEEIDVARRTGDHDYEDDMLLRLDKAVRDPKKLIVFREHGIGGVIYHINSNIKFDEVITVDTTEEATAGQDAADYDEIQELSVTGDYGSAVWLVDLETLELRLKTWKARAAELDYKRQQLEDE